MKLKALSILLAGGQLLGCSLSAIATEAISAEEKTRVCNIAQDGMAEVKLGKLAETKSSSPDVKNFATKMVHDHTEANNKLKAAAKTAKVALPQDVNAAQKMTFEELSKLTGKPFDEKYMNEMVKGHDKAVMAIGDESEKGTGILKSWAEQTIGTIKSHDQLAKKLDTNVADKK